MKEASQRIAAMSLEDYNKKLDEEEALKKKLVEEEAKKKNRHENGTRHVVRSNRGVDFFIVPGGQSPRRSVTRPTSANT